jgi:STE24 endopeptidase
MSAAWCIIILILLKWGGQEVLDWLNRGYVKKNRHAVPKALEGIIDEATYRKSADYTLAKSKFEQFETGWSVLVLLLVLFTGVLPRTYHAYQTHFGSSAWAAAAFLFLLGLALSLTGLPFEWHHQFRLEERFGFNTTTHKTWWVDRLKGLLLGILLGYPLLVLVLKLVEWTGSHWWLWAWGAMMAFQLIIAVLAPVLILPLFNKFTPLPEGNLRERLLKLAARTRFKAGSIQVMDGSKRSRHSNAFFTGFGRFRKIVLFDTLISQLAEVELEAVLAHEIGHFKKKHIPKMLAAAAGGSLIGFYVLSVLARQQWFYEAFGFRTGGLWNPDHYIAIALLLFGLLAGTVTFWLSPITHWWSRRYEYQADRFAREVMNEAAPLIGALRKLNEKNLSNLTPHPFYSGFYYSHPTLLEREAALRSADGAEGNARSVV